MKPDLTALFSHNLCATNNIKNVYVICLIPGLVMNDSKKKNECVSKVAEL